MSLAPVVLTAAALFHTQNRVRGRELSVTRRRDDELIPHAGGCGILKNC
jgi:hypothetical protein